MNGAANDIATQPHEAPIPTTHPKGFFFIFWGEFAERCCYYGMRAILVLYLVNVLKFEENDATSISFSFKAACYFLPLLGGYLADRFFGKYWTIVGFSVFYVMGLFLLCVPQRAFMWAALALMAAGSGVIKPNISTLMGLTYDQQRPGQLQLRAAAFRWFYFSVNIGSLVSLLFLPQIRQFIIDNTGDQVLAYKLSFLMPAILMIMALTAFALGKKYYAKEVIHHEQKTPEERHQQWMVVKSLLGIFVLIIFFWIAYEQNDNLWVLFIKDNVDGKLNLGFKTFEMPPDGYQWINAGCVLLFIPIFNWFFNRVDPTNTRIRPTAKILAGFFLTAATSGVMAFMANLAQTGQKVSAWWIVLAYVVLTIGEVLVYGTGLELSFAAAPASMKSFISACFLVTSGIANLLNIVITQVYNRSTAPLKDDIMPVVWWKNLLHGCGVEFVSPRNFFLATTALVIVASIAFIFVGRRFERAADNQAKA